MMLRVLTRIAHTDKDEIKSFSSLETDGPKLLKRWFLPKDL